MGSNSPRAFHDNPDLVTEKVKEFVTDQGFHGFHVPVVGGRWFDIDAKSDKVVSSMTEPDLRTFEALELLITRTHQAGGQVHIWAWGDHQRFQTPRSLEGGINGTIDRRLQRYIAARLGPIPGWSVGYGFDLDEWVKAKQLREWRDWMHERMGWHHFLGGRPAGPNRGEDHAADVVWNKGLDYSSYEHHRPTYEVYVAALQAIPDQPVMSEDRFSYSQQLALQGQGLRRRADPSRPLPLDHGRRRCQHLGSASRSQSRWAVFEPGPTEDLLGVLRRPWPVPGGHDTGESVEQRR